MSIPRARLVVRSIVAAAAAATLALGVAGPATADAPPTPPLGAPDTAAAATAEGRSLTPEEAFVWATYSVLFRRAPESTGLAYWATALTSGAPRRTVADSLSASDEFRARIIGWDYTYFLGRDADADGVAYWVGKMRGSLTLEQLEAQLVTSPEYVGTLTTEEWVTQLYSDILARPADPSEVAFWASACDSRTMSRAQVALGFLLSEERLTTMVEDAYTGLLHRSGDPAGVAFWVGQMQRGVRYESFVGSIIGSDEFWDLVTTDR